MQPIRFAVNHMTAPRLSAEELFALARALGLAAVELRNDLPGVAIADGTPPDEIRRAAERSGVAIVSVNALQRFNDWSPERESEALELVRYAAAAGADAIVLCPVNEHSFRLSAPEWKKALFSALAALRPILQDHGVEGLVEPLGFPESSLRLKSEAVEAIEAVGGGTFRLVHDTFHHFVAGEAEIFPQLTGLIHVSGVESATPRDSLRDADRVLVTPRDRLANVEQLRRLFDSGYGGFVSFEPFAESVHALPDVAAALKQSMEVLDPGRRARAA